MGISWPLHSDGLILVAARPGIMMTPWPTRKQDPQNQFWTTTAVAPRYSFPSAGSQPLSQGHSFPNHHPVPWCSCSPQQPPYDLVNLGSHQTPWPGGQIVLEVCPPDCTQDCGQWGQGTNLYKMQILADSSRAQGRPKGERELRAGQMEIYCSPTGDWAD